MFPHLEGWELRSSDLDQMVEKTEGLYIVAATMVKYVMDMEYTNSTRRLSILLQPSIPKTITHSAIDYLYLQIITTSSQPLLVKKYLSDPGW